LHPENELRRGVQTIFLIKIKVYMSKKEILNRYLVFVLGLYFLSMGIVLIVRSTLGTTPISSLNYVLSINTALSLGTCTFIINMLLILGQFWLVRDRMTRRDFVEIMLQVPFSFIFSAFIDFNMLLTADIHLTNYVQMIAFVLCGCMVQSIGVVLELKPRVAMMSAEAFVRYASQRYDKEFGRLKIGFDVTLVLCAALLSLCFTQTVEGVREGTVIAACMTGYIVTFLNTKVMTRQRLQALRAILIPSRA
jgi:uncharacterized membrane protein YczE